MSARVHMCLCICACVCVCAVEPGVRTRIYTTVVECARVAEPGVREDLCIRPVSLRGTWMHLNQPSRAWRSFLDASLSASLTFVGLLGLLSLLGLLGLLSLLGLLGLLQGF
jgi:hypothetical protein